MNNMLKLILVTILLTSGLLITGCEADSNQVPEIGKTAPTFQLKNLSGQTISLGDFQGKPILINFWATWCSPCREEMPYIQE
ncbi:unnamed protein product, partial [marine sediment metagenome]